MSWESTLYSALRALVKDQIFPDVALAGAARPYITYQAVGGEAVNYVEGGAPGTRNARVQVNVWADTRMEVSQVGNAAEDILRSVAGLQPVVLGAAVAMFDEGTGLRGQRQDFSFWY